LKFSFVDKTLQLITKVVNARKWIGSILFGVFALNWFMNPNPNPNEAFIIYCCTPYVW